MSFDAREPGTSSEEWMRNPRFTALPEFSLDGVERMIVVAAHPDDETLGAGILIAAAGACGIRTDVIVVTDGAASHPGSPSVDPAVLVVARAEEARRAVAELDPRAGLSMLGFPDGLVQENRSAVEHALRSHLRQLPQSAPGTRTLLVAPWRGDGHRDHRVVGEVCAAPAQTGFELLEYPIWLWHWSTPLHPDTPWDDFAVFRHAPAAERKRRALAAYRSQTEPLSPAVGDEALLNPTFLQNFDRDLEVYIVAESPTAQLPRGYFDETYARHEDPWGFSDRWYEQRKRSVTLAALPRPRFEHALEIGCSIGVLTAQLAPRVDELLAVDIAPAAIERARTRLAAAGGGQVATVDFEVTDVAERFPEGSFDLVLLSEVGYYFDDTTLRRVLSGVTAALRPDGVFVACHWRHRVSDYPLGGDAVHEIIAGVAEGVGWTRLARHLERDFTLDVYTLDPRSVAELTGLA